MIEIVIPNPCDRGPKTRAQIFTGNQAQAAYDWIGRSTDVYVPIHTRNYQQWAAAVKLPGGEGAARLASFEPAPTFLVPGGASGLQEDSKAQAEQVRSVAADRIGALVGSVEPQRMKALDEALRVHLALG